MTQTVYDAFGAKRIKDSSVRRNLQHYNHVSAGGGLSSYHIAGTLNATGFTTGALTADRLYALPFASPRGGTIDQLVLNVTTSGAGSSCYMGIYQATSLTNLYPNNLIVDAGTISTASTGVKTYTTGMPITLAGDVLYWFVCLCNATAPTLRCLSVGNCYPIFGIDTGIGTAAQVGLYVAQTYGALPATFPASATALTAVPIPLLACQYAT